jgi:type VI secretion system protein ImpH
MAEPDRPPRSHLAAIDGLAAAAYRFDPYEALRRIECAYAERPRLGRSLRPAEDAVRLRQNPSLRFAPAALEQYEPPEGPTPAVLKQVFFGLFGPNGPLPLHLTDYAYDRLRNERDPTFARFADLFHHRFLSLLYRAWATSRPAVAADRPDEDFFGATIDSLFGIGLDSLRRADAWPDASKRYFAGRLSCAARSPEGLQAMLADYFALPVRIEEYAGEWLPLDSDVRLRLGAQAGLGRAPLAGGSLGVDTLVGAVCWSREHRFRIVVGPLRREQFESLLPDGGRLDSMAAIVRNFIGDELAWELRLVVRRDHVPATVVGRAGRLGWNSWLAPTGREPGRVELRPRPTPPHLGAAGAVHDSL